MAAGYGELKRVKEPAFGIGAEGRFFMWLRIPAGKTVKNISHLWEGAIGVKSAVTNRQIFFLLYLTLTTYTIINIPKVLAQQAGRAAWVPILLVAAVFSLFVIIIVHLGNMFPGKMLFEYSQEIVGKFLAYVLSFYMVVYFSMVAIFFNIQLANVLKAEFFPKTPFWAMLIAGVAVFGCIAYKGVNSVARFFEIIGPIYLFTAIATHVIMLTQGNLNSIQPLFQASQMPRYLTATKDVILSFLGIEILMIIPFTRDNGKKATRVAFFSLLFIGFFYVLVVETSIMMLGYKDIQNYNYALIEAIKLVDNPVLERFDILYLTVGFSGLIAGVCAVYLALAEYACKIFSKVDRKIIVLLAGVLIVALSLVAQAAKDSALFFEGVIPVTGLVSAFLIPSLLLVIAKVRRLGQKAQ